MKFYVLKETPAFNEPGYKKFQNPDYPDMEEQSSDGSPEHWEEPTRCPVCGSWFTGRRRVPPYETELTLYTPTFADVVFYSNFLVSEKFKESFEASGLTGLTFAGPVSVVKIKKANRIRQKILPEPPVYYLAYVAENRATVDHRRSETVFYEGDEPKCPYCLGCRVRVLPRLVIVEESWDGTDIFTPKGGLGETYITSERFARWFKANGFTGAELIPAEEYSEDWRPEAVNQRIFGGDNPNEILFDEEP